MQIKVDKHLLWEAVKEPLRLLALALISWLLTMIVPQLDEKWIPIITLILRGIERWLHVLGKKRARLKKPLGVAMLKLPF